MSSSGMLLDSTSVPNINESVGSDDGSGFHHHFPLRAGVLFIGEIAAVSFISAVSLLVVTLTRHARRRREEPRYPGEEDLSALQPVSILFLFAIGMDSVQAFGSILNVRWAFNGEVEEGAYCTAQAVFKQFGNNGVAWFTMLIAIMTYIQVVHPRLLTPHQARFLTWVFVGWVFTFLLLIIAVPSSTIPGYYGRSGLWCWITDQTEITIRMRVASEYLWFWLAALVNIVLYGTIVVRWVREARSAGDALLIRDAMSMVWYPVAYLVEIFPISLVRFLTGGGHHVARGWTILAASIFAASGVINLILWLMTGRQFGFSKDSGFEDEFLDDDVQTSSHVPGSGSGAAPHFYRRGSSGRENEQDVMSMAMSQGARSGSEYMLGSHELRQRHIVWSNGMPVVVKDESAEGLDHDALHKSLTSVGSRGRTHSYSGSTAIGTAGAGSGAVAPNVGPNGGDLEMQYVDAGGCYDVRQPYLNVAPRMRHRGHDPTTVNVTDVRPQTGTSEGSSRGDAAVGVAPRGSKRRGSKRRRAADTAVPVSEPFRETDQDASAPPETRPTAEETDEKPPSPSDRPDAQDHDRHNASLEREDERADEHGGDGTASPAAAYASDVRRSFLASG